MIDSTTAGGRVCRAPTQARSGFCVLALRASAAVLIAVSSTASAGGNYALPDRTYVTNGLVSAIVRDGDTIYIGGSFDRVGVPSGPGVELALDGTQNPGLPEITGGGGSVQTVVSDGAGGWYIGGEFTRVGGIPRNGIAHILADRSVDPDFDPDADNYVARIVVAGSTVFVAGPFTQIGGQARNGIAGLNAADGSATAFDAGLVVDTGYIGTIAVSGSGDTVYAGGYFTELGGQARSSIAALNAADGSATAFNPGTGGVVLALAMSGSTLYVGGQFSTMGGQPRTNLAALTVGGALDGTATAFDPGPDQGFITALAVSGTDSTVYAAGVFQTIGGQSRSRLAGLDPMTGIANAFDPSPNSNPISLAVSAAGTVYAGGSFTLIGGEARNNVAELNAADGSVTAFNPDPNDMTVAIATSATSVYIGGKLTSLGGVTRYGLAALNAVDGSVTDFAPEASGPDGSAAVVSALALREATLYVAGRFVSMGGQARDNIAAVDLAGIALPDWNPGADSVINVLTLADSVLYAGGLFTTLGGAPRSGVGALNADDGTATAFAPDANGEISAIAVSDSYVYVGGRYSDIGGQTRWGVAELEPSDGSATSWNAHMNHDGADGNALVSALALSDGTLYVGGGFVSAAGEPRINIAALEVGVAAATPFIADADPNGNVTALAVSGSSIYAGGYFTQLGGQQRNVFAELDLATGDATAFNAGLAPDLAVRALTVASDGALYLGGFFRSFELGPQCGFASFFGNRADETIFRNGFD